MLVLLDCQVTFVRSAVVGAALNVPSAINCTEPEPVIVWLPGINVIAVKSRVEEEVPGVTVNCPVPIIVAPLWAVAVAVIVEIQEPVEQATAVANPEPLIVATLELVDCQLTLVKT